MFFFERYIALSIKRKVIPDKFKLNIDFVLNALIPSLAIVE
jgi:hypothetical protein